MGLATSTVLGTVVAAGVSRSSVAVGVAVLATLLWQLGRCRHTQPLGLLPPISDERGGRLPSRWYCDDCGKIWPASFDVVNPIARPQQAKRA